MGATRRVLQEQVKMSPPGRMTSADFRKRAQYRLTAALTDIPRDAALFDDRCSIKLRVVLVDLNASCHHSLTTRRTNPIGDEKNASRSR
jgi:hypothetical protein